MLVSAALLNQLLDGVSLLLGFHLTNPTALPRAVVGKGRDLVWQKYVYSRVASTNKVTICMLFLLLLDQKVDCLYTKKLKCHNWIRTSTWESRSGEVCPGVFLSSFTTKFWTAVWSMANILLSTKEVSLSAWIIRRQVSSTLKSKDGTVKVEARYACTCIKICLDETDKLYYLPPAHTYTCGCSEIIIT